MIKYERDPKLIQQSSIASIREIHDLSDPHIPEQQLLIRMVLAYGDDLVIPNARISDNAIEAGLLALKKNANIVCDSGMVTEGIKQQYLKKEPICLIDRPNVISQAKSKKLTRAMVSVENWKRFTEGSIVLIGNEATALLRLMELIEQEEINKPALIIGMPRGYTGATDAKQYLWKNSAQLGVPCITMDGTMGGSTLAAAAMNGLIYLHQGILI
ncbi:precorrin-8X methylmutase [Leucothrix pacifica]|uniref:Precorrin-8X methylmutase n=1 Tax=Leucothrix pacifica TaxID=1247513 RepID=A0A317CQF2_9GAMM|nr:precorrin-8X methylmutase [Leucothrix pacifica]PWQ99753.1 precorrin-8X methylmutase [Leucothrix pacifica]